MSASLFAPVTARDALALLTPSAQVLAASACADGGLARAGSLPWDLVHWPTLLSLVSWERAEQQVQRLVRSAPADRIPEDVRQTLHGLARVTAFRAATFAEAAASAVDILSSAGIDALWLKGAALAMQSDAGFDLRRMGDLDVLVRPDQLPAARAAFREGGWSFPEAQQGARYADHHHDAPMTWRSGPRLELHGAVFPHGHPFRQAEAGAWFERTRTHVWQGRAVQLLSPAWHLAHASVHWAWSHEGEVGTWQYLHDVHPLSRGGLDWREVAAGAESLGATRPVGWALWAAALVSGAPVPADLLTRLRGSGELGRQTAERAWLIRMFRSTSASPSVRWTRFWWRRAMGGLGDDRQAWPWILGEVPGSRGEVVESGVRGGGARSLGRWRRHLRQVLGG